LIGAFGQISEWNTILSKCKANLSKRKGDKMCVLSWCFPVVWLFSYTFVPTKRQLWAETQNK